MRYSLLLITLLGDLHSAAWAQIQIIQPIAAQTQESYYSYQILYTGRTLGYARIPDEQTLPANSAEPSDIAKEFLNQFELVSKPRTAQFRIAMGDNFSPDLYGRSIRVDSSIPVRSCDGNPNGFYSSNIHLPKDSFKLRQRRLVHGCPKWHYRLLQGDSERICRRPDPVRRRRLWFQPYVPRHPRRGPRTVQLVD
jgi:hypothetical protein